jgi:hypothetical protein
MADTTTPTPIMADATTPTVTTGKKPVSEKQLIANRLNSMKSTGPRTPEGKARSSMNNCQSGMRSEKDVLPGEDGALYEQRRAGFSRALAPSDAVQQALVDRFARLEWRGQRGETVEEARAELKIRDVVENAERRDAAEAAQLAAGLDESPENQALLLCTPAGLRLMIQEWSTVRAEVVQYNNVLGTQRKRCLALVGKRREDALRGDPLALQWVRALLGVACGAGATLERVAKNLGGEPPEGMFGAEFDIRVERIARSLPGKAEAQALLVGAIDAEIRRLEERLAVVEPRAEENLALAAEAARMEVTAEGSRLGQQILASYRGSDACLRRLEALKNPRQPGPGRGSRKAEPAPAGPAPPDTPTPFDDAAGDRPAGAGDPAPSASAEPDAGEAISAPRTDEAILIVADDATATVASPAPEPHAPAPTTTSATTTTATAPDTDEAILAGEPAPSPAAGAGVPPPCPTPAAPETTTDDIPIPEPTAEELQRYCPEVVAFQRLYQTLEATYGTGTGNRTTGGEPASCPPPAAVSPGGPAPDSGSAPGPRSRSRSHPPGASGADTDEAIFGRAPPSDPSPRATGGAPPGGGEGR